MSHNNKLFLLLWTTVLVLLFIFLLLPDIWVWAYLDAWRLFFYKYTDLSFFDELQSAIHQWSIFGYDRSFISVTRWLWYIIAGYFPQWLLYILFFFSNYRFSYQLLRLKFDDKSAMLGAIFFTINPVSIFFLNEIGFIFSYTSLPILLLSFYKYFRKGKYYYLLLLIIWIYLLFSYTRVTGIYLTLIIFIWAYYIRDVFILFLKFPKRLFIAFFFVILSFLPVLYALISPSLTNDNEYFSWVGSYASNSTYQQWLANKVKKTDFLAWISIAEPMRNFSFKFQKTNLFNVLSWIFILYFFIQILIQPNIDKFNIYLSWLLLLFVWITVWAKFLPEDLFIDIVFKYYPFLANNTWRAYLMYAPIIWYFISYFSSKYKWSKARIQLRFAISLIIIISVFPFLKRESNSKLGLIEYNDIPISYIETFFKKRWNLEWALFYPNEKILFEWSPYFLYLRYNQNYRSITEANSRLVNKKQSNLTSLINTTTQYENFWNLLLFGLKNIFVFKDVRNAYKDEFDFYSNQDYVSKSIEYNNLFKNLEKHWTYIHNENDEFTHFRLKSSDQYDFELYSPWSILYKDFDDLLKEPYDVDNRPIIIDDTSYKFTDDIEEYLRQGINRNVNIEIKKPIKWNTEYFFKLANVDLDKNILLQLNKTFSNNRKLRRITKNEFMNKDCDLSQSKIIKYTWSWNSYCLYDRSTFYFNEILNYWAESLSDEWHFEGNYIGNSRIIPKDVVNEFNQEWAIYWTIVYIKQSIYHVLIVVALITITLLFMISVFQIFILKKISTDEKRIS